MFSQQLAKFQNETKIKTSLRARGPPGVSGALCSLRILRIGRIGSGNTLCIIGIFCDVRPHLQRLAVFFKIAVYYCICCNDLFGAILLRLFYFPHFLHLDWHDLPYTVSTMLQQFGTDYTGCVTSLVMIGKSICPSCQKPREGLKYIRNIPGHHFTVRIHCR